MTNQTLHGADYNATKRPKIKISKLNFFYSHFQGLKNINEKKVTAFMRPSGYGKSKLLQTLNRMYDLYPGQRPEGQIMYAGRNILDTGL